MVGGEVGGYISSIIFEVIKTISSLFIFFKKDFE